LGFFSCYGSERGPRILCKRLICLLFRHRFEFISNYRIEQALASSKWLDIEESLVCRRCGKVVSLGC